MDLATRKRQLRAAMAAHGRPTSAQGLAAGEAAAAAIADSGEFASADRVALYAALPDELPTAPLFDAVRRAGKQSLFPRCTPLWELEFASVESWDELRLGRYGVLEPPAALAALAATRLSAADLVIVPGVAFDRQGVRLGRGGGYYDRTFPPGREGMPLLMGLAFAFQVVDSVPAGPGDRAVVALATECGLHRVAQAAGST